MHCDKLEPKCKKKKWQLLFSYLPTLVGLVALVVDLFICLKFSQFSVSTNISQFAGISTVLAI